MLKDFSLIGFILHVLLKARKSVKYSLCEMCPSRKFFSGPYFPAFVLNTDQRRLYIWTLFTQ